MLVNGKQTQAIWWNDKKQVLEAIDQRLLPFNFKIIELKTTQQIFDAIKDMIVRGAPVIGGTAAYGMYLAFLESIDNGKINFNQLKNKADFLKSSRPTAVNLMFAIDSIVNQVSENTQPKEVLDWAKAYAQKDIDDCLNIGKAGLPLIEEIYQNKQETVNILTHCNAGWLATGEYGTATAPIYLAHDKDIPVHIWVDETRPRNQGANLTAWELKQHGIPFTIIADNTGGHLMQHGMVDMCIVGSDRTTVNGDVANKIGTYLKALAAQDNQIPFYVALPTSTIDFDMEDGLKNIPIEKRNSDELVYINGLNPNKEIQRLQIFPENVDVVNYAFDVTPAKYVTALITEKGIVKTEKVAILKLKE